MQQPSLRIYLTANLAVYIFFAFVFFPEGLGFGLIASAYAAFFSAPTLLVLFGSFRLIRYLKLRPATSWLLLFLAVCICAFVPLAMLSFVDGIRISLDKNLVVLCFGSGSAGTLLQFFYINKYFKSLHHEAEPSIETN